VDGGGVTEVFLRDRTMNSRRCMGKHNPIGEGGNTLRRKMKDQRILSETRMRGGSID